MKRLTLWMTVAGLLTLGACNKKSENPPPGPASGTETAPPVTAPPSGSAGDPAGSGATPAGSAAPTGDTAGSAAAVDVPTAMDFEVDAEKKITDKNVEAQVKALEAELQQK